MGVNKVIYAGRTLIDTSETTVTPETLASGKTAIDSTGTLIIGTAKPIRTWGDLVDNGYLWGSLVNE